MPGSFIFCPIYQPFTNTVEHLSGAKALGWDYTVFKIIIYLCRRIIKTR